MASSAWFVPAATGEKQDKKGGGVRRGDEVRDANRDLRPESQGTRRRRFAIGGDEFSPGFIGNRSGEELA